MSNARESRAKNSADQRINSKKKIMKERLSIFQWETLAAEISNSINNLPLTIGNITGDLENLDLITPNRLQLGRNNDRSPRDH